MRVAVIRPKSETPEEIFDKNRGIYDSFANTNFKIVKEGIDSNIVNFLWFSGEFLILIGPVGILETEISAEYLLRAYGEKYPSEVKLRESCNQIGLRKENTYCSDFGDHRDYKLEKTSCLNNFECKSNICKRSKCVGEGFWDRFTNWLISFFD